MNSDEHETKDILRMYDEECARSKCKPDGLARTVLSYAQSTGELDVTNIFFSESTLNAFASILVKTNSIKCLNFTDSLLTTEALVTIVDALKSNKSVVKLILYGNNIKKEGTTALGQLLSLNNTISTLNLKWNNLGIMPDVFATFCSGLRSNEGLSHLDLRSNRIDCEGAKNLAAALRGNTTLRTIDLRVNTIRNPGAQSLLDALESNKTIETILLKSNPISHPVMIAINERLKNNSAIGKLHEINNVKNREHLEMVRDLEINHALEFEKKFESYNAKISEIQSEADSLATNLEERLTEIKRLKENLEVLENRLEQEKREKFDLNNVLLEKDKALNSVVTSSSAKVDELLQKLKDKESELLKIKADREKDTAALHRLKEDLEKELINERNVNITLKHRIRDMQARKDDDVLNQIQNLEAQRDLWAKKFRELEASAESLSLKLREESLEKQRALESTIMGITENQSTKLLILTERSETLKQEKQTLMDQISSLQNTIIRLQQENSDLITQASEPNRKIASLLEEISSERVLSHKLRQEKQEESNAREELKRQVRLLENEIANARKDQRRMELKLEEELRASQNTFRDLQRKLMEKKRKIDLIKREDQQRVKMLQDAFSRYYQYTSASADIRSDASS